MNSFITLINFETRTKCKGIYGTFKGRKQYGSEISTEEKKNLLQMIRTYLKDNSEIEIVVEDLDNHRNNKTMIRFVNSYGNLEYVIWEENGSTYGTLYDLDMKQLRKLFYKALDDAQGYIKEKGR